MKTGGKNRARLASREMSDLLVLNEVYQPKKVETPCKTIIFYEVILEFLHNRGFTM